MKVTDDNEYPGGKGSAGHAEWILSQLPSHQLFIEPFAGKAAITRAKSPALRTLLVDQSDEVIAWLGRELPACVTLKGDGVQLLAELGHCWHEVKDAKWEPDGLRRRIYEALKSLDWWNESWLENHALVYCDPPYPKSTRTKKSIYEFEWTDQQHERFLSVVWQVPCPVAISGYMCDLYSENLPDWTATQTEVMTRGGLKTETLWRNPLCVAAAAAAPAKMAREYSELGDNWRDRDRVNRLLTRWEKRFTARPPRERDAIIRRLLDAQREAQ